MNRAPSAPVPCDAPASTVLFVSSPPITVLLAGSSSPAERNSTLNASCRYFANELSYGEKKVLLRMLKPLSSLLACADDVKSATATGAVIDDLASCVFSIEAVGGLSLTCAQPVSSARTPAPASSENLRQVCSDIIELSCFSLVLNVQPAIS
ncbi:hypothetical protein D3C86_1626800 [compost metagenome]